MGVKFPFFLCIVVICGVLTRVEGVEDNVTIYQPNPPHPPTEWQSYFTGPLLAPSGTTIPKGKWDLEPFLFFTVTNGWYDENWHGHKVPNFYNLNPNLFIEHGLAERVDFTVIPSFSYNWSKGASYGGFNDLPFSVGFQLVVDDEHKWVPGIKFNVVGVVPIGKYDSFDPDNHLTDWLGQGAWAGGARLIFYKLLHIKNEHFLSLNFNMLFLKYTNVHVHGFNAYGGGVGTKGTVHPGNNWVVDFSFEYSFTRYFSFAMDTLYQHVNRSWFSGCPGYSAPCIPAQVGEPSSDEISFAPALEYNASQEFGIVAGVWFSAFGRNANRFISGVIAANFYF